MKKFYVYAYSRLLTQNKSIMSITLRYHIKYLKNRPSTQVNNILSDGQLRGLQLKRATISLKKLFVIYFFTFWKCSAIIALSGHS